MNPHASRNLKTAVGALAAFLILAVGCAKAPPPKPMSINPTDSCFYCKSAIQERFAAEFASKNGFIRKFDDMGCLIADVKKVGKKNVIAVFVMDVQSKTWMPGESAFFVRSDKLLTPQKSGIVAFKDEAKAKELATQIQGELLKIGDLLK